MNDLLNLLQRYSDNGQSTLGLLFTDTNAPMTFSGYTLEDEHRDVKVAGETRIYAGRYELRPRQILSGLTQRYRARFPWFTWHIEVMDVSGFEYVYVHVGNTDKDTDACILLGDGANNNVVADGFIAGSIEAFRRWYLLHMDHFQAGGRAFIEIRDEAWLFNRLIY